jgi:hypothetical protein
MTPNFRSLQNCHVGTKTGRGEGGGSRTYRQWIGMRDLWWRFNVYIPLMRSSWAWMSASTSWCFLMRFCTDARSLPESSDVRRDSTSPSQKSRSLTAAMYVRCLFASFSLTVFSVVFWVRYSHWSAMDARRAYSIWNYIQYALKHSSNKDQNFHPCCYSGRFNYILLSMLQ